MRGAGGCRDNRRAQVTGTATGGVENFICGESNNIHVIDYHNGELLHVYPGDNRSRLGDKRGHIGVITCLAYDVNRIYSGSADETIMVFTYRGPQSKGGLQNEFKEPDKYGSYFEDVFQSVRIDNIWTAPVPVKNANTNINSKTLKPI